MKVKFEEVYGFPDTTCHWGGYDTRATIEIKSNNFRVISTLYTSTGEIYQFTQQLKACNETLEGKAEFISYEGNLSIKAEYDNMGHVKISGFFNDQRELENELKFEFLSDQSYVKYAIQELDTIAMKYGAMKGIKK